MTNEELTMSNEEAREILSTLNIAIGTDVTPMLLKNQILKATSVAIEVLGQQACEDCISREATLKAFAENCGGECGCCKYNGSGYDTAENCKLIKSMSSVAPKQKKEKWIIYTDINADRRITCPMCNSNFVVLREYNIYNYCPNCGTEMEAES